MDLPPRYAELIEGREVDSWPIYAYLPARAGYVSKADAEARLRACKGIEIIQIAEPDDDGGPSGHWRLGLAIRTADVDDPWHMEVFIAPAESLSEEQLDWDGFTDEEKAESLAAKWEVGIDCAFGQDAAGDFHVVLKLLCAVCPSVVAIYDAASFRAHSGAWARDAAQSEVPPSLELLFSVHTVYPESDQEGKACWIHTHGLLRAACVELEALEIPEKQVDTIADFLTQVAAQFLDLGVPNPDEPFEVGEHLSLVWLPWEQAIQRLQEGHLGTAPDRDETHVEPSGVLFVPAQGVKRRRYVGLSSCVPTLERNPIYYISQNETDRASRLAAEKLPLFAALHRRFVGRTDWNFTVKLGFSNPAPQDDPEHEHLWFEVHSLDGETIDGTLLNDPHFVATMREGDRARYPIDRLTDWTIYSPHGTFTPDLVYHLLRIVDQGEPASER